MYSSNDSLKKKPAKIRFFSLCDNNAAARVFNIL